MLSIVFILLNLSEVFCCYAQYNYYQWQPPAKASPAPTTTTTTRPRFEQDDLKRNLNSAWGGFTPEPEVTEVWRKWLEDYKAARLLEEAETDEKYRHERRPGSGWPPSWNGIDGGYPGAEAPPWAYVPIHTGLPEFCYDPPIKGTCEEKLKRWAYNAYTAECVEFDYTGCDENQNNFTTKEKCEESCMITPASGCDPDTLQYIEDLD